MGASSTTRTAPGRVIDLREHRAAPVGAELDREPNSLGKRAFDVLLGTALAVLVTPAVVLMAIWLAVTLRAWPFFVQERVGQHGRQIAFLKLRTLPPSTPRYALKSEIGSPCTTRFAAFLRARHLDELPQLYLVPLGRLSLVGPRPKMPDAVEPVPAHYGATRTTVPQGCTGLWQIGVHAHLLPHEAPAYDLFYVDEWTVRMDLWILGRTVLTMLGLAPPTVPEAVPAWLRRNGASVRPLVPERMHDDVLVLQSA